MFKPLTNRTMENALNLKRFISGGHLNLLEKLEECSKYMENMEQNMKAMLEEYRKNHQIFYQLNDN